MITMYAALGTHDRIAARASVTDWVSNVVVWKVLLCTQDRAEAEAECKRLAQLHGFRHTALASWDYVTGFMAEQIDGKYDYHSGLALSADRVAMTKIAEQLADTYYGSMVYSVC